MSRTTKTGVIVGLILLAAAGNSAAGLVGVVPSGSDSNFVTIDSGSGAATVVGATGFKNLQGLAVRSDFTIFASSGQLVPVDLGTIITIDPNTGMGTAIGPSSDNPNGPIHGLAFSGSTLYAACNEFTGSDTGDSLCTIDTSTGEATYIHFFQYPGSSVLHGVEGLDFNGSTLYVATGNGFAATGPALYTCDTAMAACALVGNIRNGSNVQLATNVGDIHFSNSTLYATTGDGNLVTIDPATGIYTVVGATGVAGTVTGLGSLNVPATPTFTLPNTNTPTATPIATSTPTFTPTIPPCTLPSASNPCIPGGGSKTTDCFIEWITSPTPVLATNGLRKNLSVCYEGDPTCDADPDIHNNSCTFLAQMCINNHDPRLTCNAFDVATFEVKKPNPRHLLDVDPANLAALENEAGSGGFGVTVVEGSTVIHSGTSNNDQSTCGAPIQLQVPLKVGSGGAKKKQKVFHSIVTTSLGGKDTDTFKLECRPSTCGNGIIEPWESCDDSNRTNGDGCNQGCRVESGWSCSGQPSTCIKLTATPTSTPANSNTPANTNTPTNTNTPVNTNTPAGPTNTPVNTNTPANTATATTANTATPTTAASLCGNGVTDAGEQCDDGGACFGGTNAAGSCTSDSDCPGGGECKPVGGDGCAADCTFETAITFTYTGAKCVGGSTNGQLCNFVSTCVTGTLIGKSCSLNSDCNGGTCQSECGASPSFGCFGDGACTTVGTGGVLGGSCLLTSAGVLQNTCASGTHAGLPCTTNADCPSSTCVNACGTGKCFHSGVATSTVCNSTNDCNAGDICTGAGACSNKSRAGLNGPDFNVAVGPLSGAQTLLVGGPDAQGMLPVASRADTTNFQPVKVPGLTCACVRGMADAAAHGPGNSTSGTINCGAGTIANNVVAARDHLTSPPFTCAGGSNAGMACHPRCAAGGTNAGKPCATTGTNASECPGSTTPQKQCSQNLDCPGGGSCVISNGPGICVGGLSVGRACADSSQCLGSGTCTGKCTAGTNIGAPCSCVTNSCVNTAQCGTGGLCRVSGSRGGGFCMGPPKFCVGGTQPGKACFNAQECPGGGTCPGSGNFLGECTSDANCPGSKCNSIDDASCTQEDPPPPTGSGGTACLESFQFCTTGTAVGDPCTSNAGCPNGKCGSACNATPAHINICNGPSRFDFSGNGGTGNAFFLSTIAIGTIGDGGVCNKAAKCAGGTNVGTACQVNGDCPGGTCATALCDGFCSVTTTQACLTSSDCPEGEDCNPGAMFQTPCTGTNPNTECGANAVCVAADPSKGFDGIPCTADDPPASQGTASVLPQTTGISMATVVDVGVGGSFLAGGQLINGNCYPGGLGTTCATSFSGSPFNCASLESMSPSVSGVTLTSSFPSLDGATGEDSAIVTLLTAK